MLIRLTAYVSNLTQKAGEQIHIDFIEIWSWLNLVHFKLYFINTTGKFSSMTLLWLMYYFWGESEVFFFSNYVYVTIQLHIY